MKLKLFGLALICGIVAVGLFMLDTNFKNKSKQNVSCIVVEKYQKECGSYYDEHTVSPFLLILKTPGGTYLQRCVKPSTFT